MARTSQPIIVKKVKKAGHAHHGGAWKIAYADFVTAMMAFFLLLWLISMTTPEQKQGLADYFAPPNITATTSGSGGIMFGRSMDTTGAMMSGADQDNRGGVSMTVQNQEFAALENAASGQVGEQGSVHESARTSQIDISATDPQVFHSAAASIRQAWQALPEITEIADNLLVEETEEGLDIQILDQEGRPMFQEGSKYPFERTRQAISALAPILQQLPHQIRISGHTAAGGSYIDPRYGSWELSSDRANVVRALLGEFGLTDDRIHSVIGRSTAEPFFANDPYMAANERIRITVLNAAPPVPAGLRP